MFIKVDFQIFCEKFQAMNRNDNFSYEAKKALFDYIEELEEYSEEYELDVIALCREWSEATEEEIRQDYQLEEYDNLIKYLDDNTQFIQLDNGSILYVRF